MRTDRGIATVFIERVRSPEELELDAKRLKLAALESELAERELERSTLEAQLAAFEKRYLRIVGKRYAELDDVKASIAEALAAGTSDSRQKDDARAKRDTATKSENACRQSESLDTPERFTPNEELKGLYRRIAKMIHPDLALEVEEKKRRHDLMTRLNLAYQEGDISAMEQVLSDFKHGSVSEKETGIGAELVRLIRKMAQVVDRLRAIGAAIQTLQESELHKLKLAVEENEKIGRDILQEMAWNLVAEIGEARRELSRIRERK